MLLKMGKVQHIKLNIDLHGKKDSGVGEKKQIIINSPPVIRLLPMAYFNLSVFMSKI